LLGAERNEIKEMRARVRTRASTPILFPRISRVAVG
jgi:hypothetical protein